VANSEAGGRRRSGEKIKSYFHTRILEQEQTGGQRVLWSCRKALLFERSGGGGGGWNSGEKEGEYAKDLSGRGTVSYEQ